MSEVSVTQVQRLIVLGMWKRGTYAHIRPMITQVRQYADTNGAQVQGPAMFICHETPRDVVKANLQATADVEVVIPVGKVVEGEGDITCYELPGGQMAKIVHKGPYEKSATAYKKLFEWIAENRKKVSGPIREVYLNDPGEVEPEDILTEIYAPIS